MSASTTCPNCSFDLASLNGKGLPYYEGPAADAGTHIWPDATDFIDARVVFRQFYCPQCYTALRTEVVPADRMVQSTV